MQASRLSSLVGVFAAVCLWPGPTRVQAEVPAWLQRVETWIKDDGRTAPAPGMPPAAAQRAGQATPGAPAAAPASGRSLQERLAAGLEPGQGLLEHLEQTLSGRLDDGPELPDPAAGQPADRFFKYVNGNGKEVFTNVVESVPTAQRDGAELDLSHIPLNSELGTQINARLDAEHARLVETDYCEERRREAGTASFDKIWDEYGPLIVCGIAALLFLLVTPRMLRRVDAPAWSRALTFAIPALAIVGFTTYSMMQTNRSISQFKRAAQPCMASTFSGLSSGADPLGAKLKVIQHLKSQVHRLDELSGPPELTRGL